MLTKLHISTLKTKIMTFPKFISGQIILVKIISFYSQLSSDEYNSEPISPISLEVEKEKFNEHLLNYFSAFTTFFSDYRKQLLELWLQGTVKLLRNTEGGDQVNTPHLSALHVASPSTMSHSES